MDPRVVLKRLTPEEIASHTRPKPMEMNKRNVGRGMMVPPLPRVVLKRLTPEEIAFHVNMTTRNENNSGRDVDLRQLEDLQPEEEDDLEKACQEAELLSTQKQPSNDDDLDWGDDDFEVDEKALVRACKEGEKKAKSLASAGRGAKRGRPPKQPASSSSRGNSQRNQTGRGASAGARGNQQARSSSRGSRGAASRARPRGSQQPRQAARGSRSNTGNYRGQGSYYRSNNWRGKRRNPYWKSYRSSNSYYRNDDDDDGDSHWADYFWCLRNGIFNND